MAVNILILQYSSLLASGTQQSVSTPIGNTFYTISEFIKKISPQRVTSENTEDNCWPSNIDESYLRRIYFTVGEYR